MICLAALLDDAAAMHLLSSCYRMRAWLSVCRITCVSLIQLFGSTMVLLALGV